MRSLPIKLILIAQLCLSLNAFCQVPPAQGPPPPSNPSVGESLIREIGTFMFHNMIKNIFKDSIVPEINRNIVANNPPISITVSANIQPGKPGMGQTEYIDRPNENIIRLPYKMEYKLDFNNIPDRRLFQNIRLEISCPKWYTSAGDSIRISVVAEKPFLDGPSFTESAINFFVGGWLTPFIDNKIKQSLPSALRNNINPGLLQPKCNCLNVVVDGPAPEYKNSFIQYQYKRPSRVTEIAFNTISVKLESVKRLRAVDGDGKSLYDPIENITVELYANNELQVFPVGQISEGDVKPVTLNSMSVKKPGVTGSLILIGNIVYPNASRESNFLQLKSAQNFGNGSQKLIVRKFYWSKPVRLPNGSMTKPLKVFKDAYELTITVKVNKVVISDRTTVPVRGGVVQ